MKTYKITVLAFLIALASVLHYAEGFIPSFVPGFRLGLANLAPLFALLYLGPWYYLAVMLLKVFLVSLFTGFGTNFLLALSGAVLASIGTLACYFLTKLSIYGLSAVGAFFHVLGQILMYIVIVQTPYMLLYFPILSLLSVASGLVLAFLISRVIAVVPPMEKLAQVKRRGT